MGSCRRARLTETLAYVGYDRPTAEIVGELQLRILRMNGLEPHHNVLEIGCGALVAAREVLGYLEPGRYVGIEPNAWLIGAAIEDGGDLRELVNERKPLFLVNDDFDATAAGRRFEFVLSHSILSHAADWQVPLFMRSVATSLAAGGVAVASIRFTDQDGVLQGDSHDADWVYPDNSFFSPGVVLSAAAEAGLSCEWVPEYRELVTSLAPTNFHDWIRLSRPGHEPHGFPPERGSRR